MLRGDVGRCGAARAQPYPGTLGVIEQGALADLLVPDGNPHENIHLMKDPEKSLAVVMKDGKIRKNLL